MTSKMTTVGGDGISLVAIIALLQKEDMFQGSPSQTRYFETEEKNCVSRKLCCCRSDFVLKTGNKPTNLYHVI